MRDPSRVRVTGPLQQYAPGFVTELARLGYKPKAAAFQVQLMAHLSRWMDAGRLEPVGLAPLMAGAFLAARRAEGYVMWLSPRALVPLLGFLRRLGVVPPPVPAPVTPAEALLGRYQRYLVTERGLAVVTARGYVDMVRPFLAGREEGGGLALAELTAAEVTAFMLAACPGKPKGTAKLTVMARLGLRAGEVAVLSLDDISWRAGEITVHGKGSRAERLPLPADVGEAVAAYLAGGRPEPFEGARQVFLRARAPHRGCVNTGSGTAIAVDGDE